jgi:hypothetical protein
MLSTHSKTDLQWFPANGQQALGGLEDHITEQQPSRSLEQPLISVNIVYFNDICHGRFRDWAGAPGGAVEAAIRKSKSNTSMALMTAINPEGEFQLIKRGNLRDLPQF